MGPYKMEAGRSKPDKEMEAEVEVGVRHLEGRGKQVEDVAHQAGCLLSLQEARLACWKPWFPFSASHKIGTGSWTSSHRGMPKAVG